MIDLRKSVEHLICIAAFGMSATIATNVNARTDSSADGAWPKEPVPIAFEGGHALAMAAVRQRLLTQNLGFILTVDSNGNVTNCELSRKFRRRATTIALCRPFLKYMTFEPALDAEGKAIEGTYRFDLDFNMLITDKGNLDGRIRN